MKRKIAVSLLTVVTVAVMVFALVSCAADSIVYDDPIMTLLEYDTYTLLEDFVAECPDRTTGVAAGADAAAAWIGAKLSEIDQSLMPSLQSFDYSNPFYDKRTETGYNVIAKKKSAGDTDKTVVIGTHYDNAYGLKINGSISGAEGVYNNAGSVIALIQTAAALKNLSFDFNIEYVFFGAGEANLSGSAHYVNEMKGDVILMVNYDGVVGGEFLYYYDDEVKTGHGELLGKVIKDNRLNIFKTPKFNHNIGATYIDGTNLGYYHEALYGDNVNFMIKGINTLSFSSANYSDYSSGTIKEIKGKSNIEYTAADTLKTVVERYGGGQDGIDRINDSVNALVTAVQDTLGSDGFVDKMIASRNAKFDYSVFGNIKIMSYIAYGILGAVLIVALGLYFGLRGKAKTHPVLRMTPYGMMDVATGEIKGAASPSEPIDPFAGDENLNPKAGGEPKDADNVEKSAKDVDKTDIFEDF